MSTTRTSNKINHRRWQQFILAEEPSVAGIRNYTNFQHFLGGLCEVGTRVDVDNTEIILIVICDHELEFGGFLFTSIVVLSFSI